MHEARDHVETGDRRAVAIPEIGDDALAPAFLARRHIGDPAQFVLRARLGDALVVDLARVIGIRQLLAVQRAERGVDQRAVGGEHHAEEQPEQDHHSAAGQRLAQVGTLGKAALRHRSIRVEKHHV